MDGISVRRAAFAACAVWLLWALHPLLAARLYIPWKPETVGQWGDSFGALNALFSALAFIAVLFTLKQQRDELSRQQAQIKDSERNQHVQRFEQTFYELLRLLREARDEVEFRHTGAFLGLNPNLDSSLVRNLKGTAAIKAAQRELEFWLRGATGTAGDPVDNVVRLYVKHVHSRYESTLAPYFRMLFTLLSRISDDPVLEAWEKHRYGNLLRSQLTSHEVALCCYNGLAPFAGRFKNLLIEFRIARYLPDEVGRQTMMIYYPLETFMGRD